MIPTTDTDSPRSPFPSALRSGAPIAIAARTSSLWHEMQGQFRFWTRLVGRLPDYTDAFVKAGRYTLPAIVRIIVPTRSVQVSMAARRDV